MSTGSSPHLGRRHLKERASQRQIKQHKGKSGKEMQSCVNGGGLGAIALWETYIFFFYFSTIWEQCIAFG